MSAQVLPYHFAPDRRESRGPRANTHARSGVLRMLKEDHRLVKTAFREFERLDALGHREACEDIVRQTCAELEIHTRLEEEVFYPAVRAALPSGALIDDAQVEHQTMKMLLKQVRGARSGEPLQSASFRVLGEYVKHHVKEEEGEMFRQLSHARLNWLNLLEEMLARRRVLTAECPDLVGADVEHGPALTGRPGLDGQGWRGDRPF